MQNFVYPIIGDPQTRDCVVIDPAGNIDEIVDRPRPSVTRSGDRVRAATARLRSAAESIRTARFRDRPVPEE